MEEWKAIYGYEGLYAVSNFGNVKSLNYSGYGYEKNLKPSKNKNGYLKIVLNKKTYYIHRLVCINFVSNIKSMPQVNHKNGNKIDNHVDNLEWVNNQENSEHKIKILKYSPSNECKFKASVNHNKKIVKYDLDGNFLCEYDSASQASKLLTVNRVSISYCCNGIRTSAGGYKWSFK